MKKLLALFTLSTLIASTQSIALPLTFGLGTDESSTPSWYNLKFLKISYLNEMGHGPGFNRGKGDLVIRFVDHRLKTFELGNVSSDGVWQGSGLVELYQVDSKRRSLNLAVGSTVIEVQDNLTVSALSNPDAIKFGSVAVPMRGFQAEKVSTMVNRTDEGLIFLPIHLDGLNLIWVNLENPKDVRFGTYVHNKEEFGIIQSWHSPDNHVNEGTYFDRTAKRMPNGIIEVIETERSYRGLILSKRRIFKIDEYSKVVTVVGRRPDVQSNSVNFEYAMIQKSPIQLSADGSNPMGTCSTFLEL